MKDRKELRANYDYICDCCGETIKAKTNYICVRIHSTSQTPVKNSKKLYHGKVYYHTNHYNEVYRYHTWCEQ